MTIVLTENKKHIVIKRNGTEEEFNWDKLNRVLNWAVSHKTGISEKAQQSYIDMIKNNLSIRINDRIHIAKLFDEVIDVCANLVSRMYPEFDAVARNLYIQKLYKEIWGIKRNRYPDYNGVVQKGIRYKVYNKHIFDTFTDDEINELGTYIDPTMDFLFTFSGLQVFVDKYLARYTKTKILELPQHRLMAVAIQLHYKDDNRMETIKKHYDILKYHMLATATPVVLNSLKLKFNPTSCVLIEVDDDSESIMETARAAALYSKHASGLGVNVSNIRCIGSKIDTWGESSGVIPFIKIYESTISSFNQLSVRPGSMAIYYPWWHYESPEMIMLKDAGGNEDTRARKLKYAMINNKLLLDAVRNDDMVYLFDPKETPLLSQTWGEDFEKAYKHYSERTGIKKRQISARELFYMYIKVYVETGNNYYFSKDNVNRFNMGRDLIKQGNLCCAEVCLPTKPLKAISTKLVQDEFSNNGSIVEKRKYDGEIGICNLSGINLVAWDRMTKAEKDDFCYTILCGMDNQIDYAYYPVKAGEKFNKVHRAIGIGVTNYHTWLAEKRVKMSDEKAIELTHYIMEDVMYYILKNSNKLAKERGKYANYKGSKWDKGILPFELYEKHFGDVAPELNFEYKHDWSKLKESIAKYGVRFEYHMSIPPGATSSAVFALTEGIEPIRDIVMKKEGTYNMTILAPNLKKNWKYYERAWDIPTEHLLRLAAVRQKFLDQSQSLNIYVQNPDSAYEVFNIIDMAETLGLKSLYYFNSLKQDTEEVCESCAV